MKISIRNVSRNNRLSRETPCFEAEIILDGRPAGRVRNDGGGGANIYEFPESAKRLADYAKTLPPVELSFGGKIITVPQSAETLIFGLV